jgi:hypothetical protein
MNDTNDSISHELDGYDPDSPQRTRLSREAWQWACDAREDWQVLMAMHPEELRRYCGKR